MKQKSKKGFTLVEIMIVIVIMSIMMLIGYAPYNFYQQKAKVKVAGREIAQAIYEAKNLAISGKSFVSGDDNKNKSIGVVFSAGGNSIKYYEYDEVVIGNPPVVPAPSGDPFKEKYLQKGIVFSPETDIRLFFEAISGDIYVNEGDYSEKNIIIHYGREGVTDPTSSLLQKITYFPKTNTTFYK